MKAPDNLSPMTAQLLATIEDHTGLLAAEILGRGRRADLVEARQIAFWILTSAGLSAAEIGRQMNRDHSTVIHGRRALSQKMIQNEEIVERMRKIAKDLGW